MASHGAGSMVQQNIIYQIGVVCGGDVLDRKKVLVGKIDDLRRLLLRCPGVHVFRQRIGAQTEGICRIGNDFLQSGNKIHGFAAEGRGDLDRFVSDLVDVFFRLLVSSKRILANGSIFHHAGIIEQFGNTGTLLICASHIGKFFCQSNGFRFLTGVPDSLDQLIASVFRILFRDSATETCVEGFRLFAVFFLLVKSTCLITVKRSFISRSQHVCILLEKGIDFLDKKSGIVFAGDIVCHEQHDLGTECLFLIFFRQQFFQFGICLVEHFFPNKVAVDGVDLFVKSPHCFCLFRCQLFAHDRFLLGIRRFPEGGLSRKFDRAGTFLHCNGGCRSFGRYGLFRIRLTCCTEQQAGSQGSQRGDHIISVFHNHLVSLIISSKGS